MTPVDFTDFGRAGRCASDVRAAIPPGGLRLGRIVQAVALAASGWWSLRDPNVAAQNEHQTAPVQHTYVEMATRALGALRLVSSLTMATGRLPRVAPLTVAATLLPSAVVGHRWWREAGDRRRTERSRFAVDLALLGGLLVTSASALRRPTCGSRQAARCAAAARY